MRLALILPSPLFSMKIITEKSASLPLSCFPKESSIIQCSWRAKVRLQVHFLLLPLHLLYPFSLIHLGRPKQLLHLFTPRIVNFLAISYKMPLLTLLEKPLDTHEGTSCSQVPYLLHHLMPPGSAVWDDGCSKAQERNSIASQEKHLMPPSSPQTSKPVKERVSKYA